MFNFGGIRTTVLLISGALSSPYLWAQSATAISDGKAFAATLAPTSASQVVNPNAVNQNIWATNTNTATTVPTGLGGFSQPTNSATNYNTAKAMGLSAFGTTALTDCANHVPGTDLYKDQACAATNFLSNQCITPNSQQSTILTNTGTVTGVAGNCNGSYGQAINKFGYNNTVTPANQIFTSMAGLKASAPSMTGQTCTTVSTTKPVYTNHSCTMSNDMTQYSCSQHSNVTLITQNAQMADPNSCDKYGGFYYMRTYHDNHNDDWLAGSSSEVCANAYIMFPSGGRSITAYHINRCVAANPFPGLHLAEVNINGDLQCTCHYMAASEHMCPYGTVLVNGVCTTNASTTTISGTACTPGDPSCVVTAVQSVQILDTCTPGLPAGAQCKQVTQQTTWSNACAGYAASAGTPLPTPN